MRDVDVEFVSSVLIHGIQYLKQEMQDSSANIDQLTTICGTWSSCELTLKILDNMLTSDSIESGNLVLCRKLVLFEAFIMESLQPFFIEVLLLFLPVLFVACYA